MDDKLSFKMYLDFLGSSEGKPKDGEGSNEGNSNEENPNEDNPNKDNRAKKAKGNDGRPVSILPDYAPSTILIPSC